MKGRVSSFTRRVAWSLALAGVTLAGAAVPSGAPQAQVTVPFTEGPITVLPVRDNIYLLAGGGANVTVSIGRRDGILLVDSGDAGSSAAVIAAVRTLAGRLEVTKPLRYIINTNARPDHVGGNEQVGGAGKSFAGGLVVSDLSDVGSRADVLAHENVLNRMSNPGGGAPSAAFNALPTLTYYMASMKLSHFFNGEGIRIEHQPAAASDGDSIVYFRGSDVIAAGDVYGTTSYPVIDLARGGSAQGLLASLNRMLDLAIPENSLTEGGTMIIPGHGRLSDSADLAYYRDMVTIIRDRIKGMVDKGMTLEAVMAARPTKDYDTRYGNNPAWSTSMFVEAMYRSLSPAGTK